MDKDEYGAAASSDRNLRTLARFEGPRGGVKGSTNKPCLSSAETTLGGLEDPMAPGRTVRAVIGQWGVSHITRRWDCAR